MIVFCRPTRNELDFRAALLADEDTMAYNAAWGGAIGFPRARWDAWYARWVAPGDGKRFYRYLRDSATGEFVGEAAYHYDAASAQYRADVIVRADCRGRGFGRAGMTLLCEAARLHGINTLWDEIAPGNAAAAALLSACCFTREGGTLYRRDLRTMLNRVLVIGCPGAGKSTFARALRDAAGGGLPLIYLDMLFHRPDRTTASREEFDAAIAQAMAQPRWIIDGNYQRTLPLRFAACDTVYCFDLPVEQCLAGAAARIGQAREDMPWTEETFDPEFRQYILDFPRDQRPAIAALIDRYQSEKRIVVFRTRDEATQYLRGMARGEKEETG